MQELKRRLLHGCLCIADLAVMILAVGLGLALSGQLTGGQSLGEFFAVRVKLINFVIVIGFAVVWHLLFKFFKLYRSRRIGLLASEWWNICRAVLVGTMLMSGLALILDLSAVNRIFLTTFFAVALVGTIGSRTFLRSILGEARRNGRNLRNLVIVGCGPRGMSFGREVRSKPELGYLLLGYIDEIEAPENPLHGNPEHLLGPPSRAREILQEMEVDEVFISLPIKSYYETMSNLIELCEDMGLVVRVPADFFESRLVNAHVDVLEGTPILTLQSQGPPVGCAVVKRAIDCVGSVIGVILLSPLFALVALATKLDSKGPVFFVQKRVGLGRVPFHMVKFRTMHVDAENRLAELEDKNEVKGAAFKMENDPRITRVGRIVRKLSIDELPQLINVIRGEMSLVGPRPLPIRDVKKFDSEWQKRRFSVKPGLTCLWQINGRHNIEFENWMELDLQYIDNWSLSLDFDILLKTVPAVLRGHGAS